MPQSPLRALALVAAILAAAPAPALAVPGQPLAPSMKLARAQKKVLMGVIYYVQKGKVAGESWNSEMGSWTLAEADRLRAIAIGKRKLKSKLTSGNSHVDYLYTDGANVRYNLRRGKVITMDVLGKGFELKMVASGKFEQVKDWKEVPWKGKAW